MNKEKEIQNTAAAIEKAKMLTVNNAVWYKIAAGYLFSAGYCSVESFLKNFFEKVETYINKWYSRAEEEKDKDYAWGMRSACTSAMVKIGDMKAEYKINKQNKTLFYSEKKENEKQIAEVAKIIHFCACGSQLTEDENCDECEKIASNLLSLGYCNRCFLSISILDEIKNYLKAEMKRTKDQIDDNKDDAQYVVGKIYVFGRFEEKIKELEKNVQEDIADAELFLKRIFSDSEKFVS